MPIRTPTDSPRPAPGPATRPATDGAGTVAGARAEHAADVGVTRPQTSVCEPVDDHAARSLANRNAGSGTAVGKPLVAKTSPVGAFFHKQVALPAPAQVYEALRALPPAAFAADVEALWRLGEEQGQIKGGKLHPLSLEIVDRRLHNAMARATFEVALGVTRDKLLDIVRRATLSALREMPGHDGIPWGQLGAFLSPPERDLVATAMANLGAPGGPRARPSTITHRASPPSSPATAWPAASRPPPTRSRPPSCSAASSSSSAATRTRGTIPS